MMMMMMMMMIMKQTLHLCLTESDDLTDND